MTGYYGYNSPASQLALKPLFWLSTSEVKLTRRKLLDDSCTSGKTLPVNSPTSGDVNEVPSYSFKTSNKFSKSKLVNWNKIMTNLLVCSILINY